jgi:exonuclease III
MKIATYNVRNLFDPGTKIDDRTEEVVQESFFLKRIEYLKGCFTWLDLDIICLQEIGGELGVKMLGEALGYDYFFARPNKRGIRMAVMYKKALAGSVTCESITFGELTVPAIEQKGDTSSLKPIVQRRDILEVTVQIGEKVLSINTFHLKSNLPQYLEGDDMEQDLDAYVDAKWRCVFYKTMELCALRRHANKRIQEGKEILLLGDYNETNIASIMDILTGAQNREKPVFYDLLAGYAADPVTHMHRGKKLVFDTIIASSGIKSAMKEIKVENETLKDYSGYPQGAIEHEIESDHALVWVDLKL